jgi:hypothetical protein
VRVKTCHSPHDLTNPTYPIDQARKGAGWELPIPELGRVVAPNITSDVETGLGAWSDDEIARASGQLAGRTLNHIMPFEFFRNLTGEDLGDIWAYLQAQPPVKHRVNNTDPPTPCPVCKQSHGLGDLNQAGQ